MVNKLVRKIKWILDGPSTEMYMYGGADFEANKAMQEPLEKLYKYENQLNRTVAYAVEVMSLGGLYPVSRISQDAYYSYDDAVNFIKTRNDNPKKVNEYEWKSETYKYDIISLHVA